MTDWKILHDAYGSAEGVPDLIQIWRADPSEEHLQNLWSHLCHQGSVYSASFAAVPLLLQAAHDRSPKLRRDMLLLVAAILASPDVRSGDGDVGGEVLRLLPALEAQALEHLADEEIDEVEAIYLLQAAAAFRGDKFWGSTFDRLAGSEFSGRCPACDAHLQFAIGGYGYFCTAGDWVRDPTAPRNPIVPANGVEAPAELATIALQALEHGRSDISEKVRYIVGLANCTACGETISVLASIQLWAGNLFAPRT
jgi:hypothetical protein